jgi:proliferating cell nuclear antigen
MKLTITELSKATKFQYLFSNLKLFSESINLNVDENRIYAQGMDKSQCCLFQFNLKKSWFDEYAVDEDCPKDIGIPSYALYKMLNTRNDNQTIEIVHSNNEDNINIAFSSNDATKTYNKYFQLPLMDIDSNLLNVPETESDADITINSSVIKGIVDELSIFDEKINIMMDQDTVQFKTSGNEGNMTITLNNNDIIEFCITEGETINQTYNLKLLKGICNYNKLANDVKLSISNNKPLVIRFNLDDDDNFISFYLAPYMEDE